MFPALMLITGILPLVLQTGDILLTHCESTFLGRLTLRLSGGPCTHQALAYDSSTIVEAGRAIGKLQWVELGNWIAAGAADKPATEWAIYRRRMPFTSEQIALIQKCLDEELTWNRYSVAELVLQASDDVLARLLNRPRLGLDVVVFRRLGNVWKNGVICSKAANWPLIKVGALPEYEQYAAPSDTWAYITAPTIAAQADRPAERLVSTKFIQAQCGISPAPIFMSWTRVAESDNWRWA